MLEIEIFFNLFIFFKLKCEECIGHLYSVSLLCNPKIKSSTTKCLQIFSPHVFNSISIEIQLFLRIKEVFSRILKNRQQYKNQETWQNNNVVDKFKAGLCYKTISQALII